MIIVIAHNGGEEISRISLKDLISSQMKQVATIRPLLSEDDEIVDVFIDATNDIVAITIK